MLKMKAQLPIFISFPTTFVVRQKLFFENKLNLTEFGICAFLTGMCHMTKDIPFMVYLVSNLIVYS